MGLVVGQWILRRTSGIPRRFFLQGQMTSQRERAWVRDHRTHSLIFDYYKYKYKQGAIIRDGYLERGVHATPCVVPKNLSLEKKLRHPSRHKPRGYTQICVGLLPYMEIRKERPVWLQQIKKKLIVTYFECGKTFFLPCTYIFLPCARSSL